MITTKDIVRGTNKLLNSKYKGLVFSTDDKKKIKNGSFRVETPYPIITRNSNFEIEEGTIRIYYFPLDEDETRLDFLNKQEELNNLFRHGIEIAPDVFLPISEIEFSETDNVMVTEFDYIFSNIFENESEINADLMENLEMKEV